MNKAYDFILNKLDISYGDGVVVGVSGGPDSMALLHLLAQVKKELSIFIICAHVNHNVRKESAKEAEFLEKYCDNNSIIFESMKIEDYGDDNFHNEARTKRYNYFGEMVKKYNAKFLFTAHHADDLIETILMRIVRGSTLRGYSGFSRTINMEDYKIVRPLIDVTKEEIYEYLEKNKISYVTDPSNKKDKYTRNRYRKYILPFFKSEDKNVHNKFLKFSETLLEYNSFIDRIVEKEINKIYVQNVLKIDEFKKLEKIIQQKIVYYILEHIYQDDLMLIYDRHAELIIDLIYSNKPNSYIVLPNELKVLKEYDSLMFIFEERLHKNQYEIELHRYANLPNGKNIELVDSANGKGNDIVRLSSKEVVLPLHVRTRNDGDKIDAKGMLGRKKVKDIFIDMKVPVSQREIWPVVIDSAGKIVWLPDLKKSKFDKEINEDYDIILRYY